MKVNTLFVGAAALFSNSILGQNLNKPTLFSDGLHPHVDTSLWANTASPQWTSAAWIAYLAIPQRCYQEAKNLNLDPTQFEVFSVKYTDCSAWTFCRHFNAPLSQSDMIDLFGRLPVQERQWVQHVMAVPGGGSAYNSASVLVFQGAVGTPSVFQHETSHSLDFYANPVTNLQIGTGAVSDTTYWRNAVQTDTCVPDSYANSNYIEDFAQVGVLALFQQVNPGGMDPAFGWTWHCLLLQLQGWVAELPGVYVPGGTCNRRWADSSAVYKSGGAPYSKRSEEVQSGEQPAPFFSGVTHYNVSSLVIDEGARAKAKAAQATWAEEAATKGKMIKRSARFAKLFM